MCASVCVRVCGVCVCVSVCLCANLCVCVIAHICQVPHEQLGKLKVKTSCLSAATCLHVKDNAQSQPSGMQSLSQYLYALSPRQAHTRRTHSAVVLVIVVTILRHDIMLSCLMHHMMA